MSMLHVYALQCTHHSKSWAGEKASRGKRGPDLGSVDWEPVLAGLVRVADWGARLAARCAGWAGRSTFGVRDARDCYSTCACPYGPVVRNAIRLAPSVHFISDHCTHLEVAFGSKCSATNGTLKRLVACMRPHVYLQR